MRLTDIVDVGDAASDEETSIVDLADRSAGMAGFNKVFTLEQVLDSPMVATPLTLYACCPNGDGAAATIVCSRDRLAAPRRSARIAASVLTSGLYDRMRDLTWWEWETRAARLAYDMAGLAPSDINVVEVHDAFTISELEHYEGLGLCARGESGAFIDSGATRLDGRIPVNNPSGGLLARGRPPGASGLAQIDELLLQMRHEAGPRQTRRAGVALAQIMGVSKSNDAQACTIHILSKDLG
ncbi:thiolase family protein [Paraburkholderia sp. BL9I2N2]|uniref:thiolase family protein n=1 Tax=Paraburkholderia sp. BL9I2N2 TaxID=1938809 RepID=UPI0014050397|nr:thiolase family protein [Paraburkholderia sp. BL9I2N2]